VRERAAVERPSGGALGLRVKRRRTSELAARVLPVPWRWSAGEASDSGVIARAATAGGGGGGSQVSPVASFLARVRVSDFASSIRDRISFFFFFSSTSIGSTR
jgi:hypothetical protein